MLRIRFPAEGANRAVQDGTLPRLLQATMAELKSEAAYFFADGGQRTAMIFFDMKESSQLPSLAEPYWMAVNASVECVPVMNAEELKAGIERAAKKF
jgi:hypothetical protein